MSSFIRTLLLALACGFTPSLAFASMTAEVLKSEQARIAALVNDDYSALEQLLADDLTYTHSNAAVENKVEYLTSLTSGRLKYKKLEHRDLQVRIHGDVAILAGETRVHSIANGHDVRLQLRFTIVYIKQSDQWRMIAWHSTRLP